MNALADGRFRENEGRPELERVIEGRMSGKEG
jgi:hypothetical protein